MNNAIEEVKELLQYEPASAALLVSMCHAPKFEVLSALKVLRKQGEIEMVNGSNYRMKNETNKSG